MMKNYFFTIFTVFTFSILSNAQTSFADWNFDLSTLNPSSGTGTATLIGGCGNVNYVNYTGNGKALSFADFPTDFVGSGTAGIEFKTSTLGLDGISLSFETYGGNPSSKWQQYEYTIDGINWVILSNNNGTLNGNWTITNLTFPSTCNNNPNFGFRIVSIFNPNGGTQYESVQGGGYNGSNGKWYFDNVGVRYNTLSTESNSIEGLTMYPNPLKGNTLYFNSTANADMSVQIYDVLGKEVLNSKVMNNTVNVSGLNAGAYIVKVTEEGKTATRKLVIQ